MTFLITYTTNNAVGVKKMRVKNAANEFEAKAKLAKYLERKGSTGLIIHTCRKDNPFSKLFESFN